MLHLPEQFLYGDDGEGIYIFRQSGSFTFGGGGEYPISSAFDRTGTYYVGDYFGSLSRIRFDHSADVIPGFTGSRIRALACDRAGNLFVAEDGPIRHAITKITPTGGAELFLRRTWVHPALWRSIQRAICSQRITAPISSINSLPRASRARFSRVFPAFTALAFDTHGNLLVADDSYDLIGKLDSGCCLDIHRHKPGRPAVHLGGQER